MSAIKPGWGSQAHAPVIGPEFHVETFKGYNERKPCKIWCLGEVQLMVLHYRHGKKSLPCAKINPDDYCPFCKLHEEGIVNPEYAVNDTKQYEGYVPCLISDPKANKWYPATAILTQGLIKKLSTRPETRTMYPQLRGVMLTVWRASRGSTSVPDCVYDNTVEPPVPAWDIKPYMERFWNPLVANELPELPEPIMGHKAGIPANVQRMSPEALARAQELADAMRAAQEAGQPFDAQTYWAEKKRREDEEVAKGRLLMEKVKKRNTSEGKHPFAPREDMDQPHPADEHELGWMLTPAADPPPPPPPKPDPVRDLLADHQTRTTAAVSNPEYVLSTRTATIVNKLVGEELPTNHPAKPKRSRKKNAAPASVEGGA